MYTHQLIEKNGIDAVLVTKNENVKFFTGFSGTFGQAIITPNKDYLITDARYALEAKKLCYPEVKIIIIEDYYNDLHHLLQNLKISHLGFEDHQLTVAQLKNIKKNLIGYKFKPLGKKVDYARIIKTPEEIRLIRKSQIINEKALHEGLKLLRNKNRITEKELAWKLIEIGHNLGAEDISFDPIVAFGTNSASPHYTPSSKKYNKNHIVLIDMGMKYRGYCSDMTRTFLPKNPPGKIVFHYEIVLEAQKNCISKLKPGKKAAEGDMLSRSVIEKFDLGEKFTHANGHGIGLEIHEAPSLSSKAKHTDKSVKLAEDMVVTVEPGIYLEGKYGIRIEDIIAIGKSGNKNLTTFPKKLSDIIIK